MADLRQTLSGIGSAKPGEFELQPEAVASKRFNTPAHRAAVWKAVEAAAEDGGEVTAHGMTTPEKTRRVVVGGTAVHWTEGAEDAAAETIASLAEVEVPPQVAAATTRIVHTTQRNKDDGLWEKKYNTPGFRSQATGGDGTTVVYNGQGADPYVLSHEAGHNVATALWGTTAPPAGTRYADAAASEPPVSKYGANSPSEDFAEAFSMYAIGGKYRDGLKAKFPKKYAALKGIFEENAWPARPSTNPPPTAG